MQTSNKMTAATLATIIATLSADHAKSLAAINQKEILKIVNATPAAIPAGQYNKPAQKHIREALTALIAALPAPASQPANNADPAASNAPTTTAQLITAISQITANCCYKSAPKAKVTYKVLATDASGQLIIQHISPSYPATGTAANTFAYTAAAAANILKYAAAKPANTPASIYSPTAAALMPKAPAAPAAEPAK